MIEDVIFPEYNTIKFNGVVTYSDSILLTAVTMLLCLITMSIVQ